MGSPFPSPHPPSNGSSYQSVVCRSREQAVEGVRFRICPTWLAFESTLNTVDDARYGSPTARQITVDQLRGPVAEGKTKKEALRALKRRVSNSP